MRLWMKLWFPIDSSVSILLLSLCCSLFLPGSVGWAEPFCRLVPYAAIRLSYKDIWFSDGYFAFVCTGIRRKQLWKRQIFVVFVYILYTFGTDFRHNYFDCDKKVTICTKFVFFRRIKVLKIWTSKRYSLSMTRTWSAKSSWPAWAGLRLSLFRQSEACTRADGAGDLPDLIISDIRMPDMRGDEFLHAVKSDERFRHIRMVMLSSEDSTSERIQLLQDGAEDYIVKPFNPMELKVRIEKFLKWIASESGADRPCKFGSASGYALFFGHSRLSFLAFDTVAVSENFFVLRWNLLAVIYLACVSQGLFYGKSHGQSWKL